MKKWKSSKGLKIAMVILSALSAAVVAACGVAVAFMADMGIYSKPRQTVLQDAYDRYSYIYSVVALANRNSEDGTLESLDKTNFRYGIVKAEDIERVDISDPASYQYTNFEAMPAADALKKKTAGMYEFEVGPGTEYNWDCSLFGDAGVRRNDYADSNVLGVATSRMVEITGVYYNTADGIFYYSTPEGFYRIDTVQMNLSDNGEEEEFQYDSGQKAYYNADPYNCLVDDYYVTFNMFDGTDMPWETWNEIYLNGNGYTHTDIRFVTDEYTYMNEMLGKPIIEEYYSYNGGDYLEVYSEDAGAAVAASQTETYYVVYQVNDPLQATGLRYYRSMFDGDLYEQATALLNLCYAWQYAAILVLGISFVLWVVSTLLVFTTAGHRGSYETVQIPAGWRSGTQPEEGMSMEEGMSAEEKITSVISSEEIYQRDMEEVGRTRQPMRTEKRWADKVQAGFWQKVPFDLETFVVFIAGGCILALLMEISDEGFSALLIPAFLAGIAGYMIALGWLADFAIRIKLGKWWRGTLLYKICAWIFRGIGRFLKKIIGFFRENVSLLGKTIVILLGLSFLEFIGIVITARAPGVELVLWFVYKAVITVAVLLGVVQMHTLKTAAERMAAGNLQEKVKTEKMFWEFKKHGETLNSISDGLNLAVEKRMQSEHFRTELITNVSHDIKTPLTSIINYVDLLQKEHIENEKAEEYLEVLSRQSARLKKLTEDLVEASKASTGSMPVNMERLELGVFLTQTLGEFQEKLEQAGLRIVMHKPEKEIAVQADGRHLWRVVENLIQNICKYAQTGTRVYIDLEERENEAVIFFKNISGYELNVSGEELMERFVRGDASRHTEGSGLGLSIAGSLMELMGGRLEIIVDGDLFKVVLHFRMGDA